MDNLALEVNEEVGVMSSMRSCGRSRMRSWVRCGMLYGVSIGGSPGGILVLTSGGR